MSDAPNTVYLKDYEPPVFLAPKIDMEFDLLDSHTELKTTIEFQRNSNSQDDSTELFLDGTKLMLTDIKRDGSPLGADEYEQSDSGLLLKNCPDRFTLETTVQLSPEENKAFSGLYKTKTVYCTQMEAQGFRRTTFFMDRPDVLSKYTTTIRANKAAFPILLSNGNFIEQKEIGDGRHEARWEDPFPKPCYLFALVAGDFDWIEDSFMTRSKRKVDLKIYVDKGKSDRARYAMDALKQSMKWDEETYRLEYDLDIYNIVAVDDFNMGAMENKGLNIFNSKYVLASPETATDDEYQAVQRVIGHEYFHNWTGNRVTCRDWFQLSLKEGLTVFRDQEFSADMNSRPVKRIEDVAALRSRQFPEDSGPMAHPVRPSSYIAIDNFYTVTVYEKGAEVIRMLESVIGKDMFKKGVTKYFELFDGQAVTTDDWIHAMELVSERDLTQFKLWYDQAGTPEVSVSTQYNDAENTLSLTLQQNTLDPLTGEANKAYHIPFQVGLVSEQGAPMDFKIADSERDDILELTKNQQTFHLTDVYQKPVLSFNRGFTAPVQLNFEQPDKDLYLLMKKDTDSFNRWESAQKLFRQTLLAGYNSLKSGGEMTVPETLIQALSDLISRGSESPALTARLIELPMPQFLAQFLEEVNPKLLGQAYQEFYQQVSWKIGAQVAEVYQDLQARNLGHSPQDAALRSFKNNLLSYLHRNDEEAGAPLFYEHFKTATNMTDSLSALRRLSYSQSSKYQQAMEDFYTKWSDDALIMNKWLTVAALAKAESTFMDVKQKTQSEVYDSSNPNNAFALLYYFAQYNWPQFHSESGETYDWYADQIIDVDSRNPQVSSRLATAFNNWKKFSSEYQKPMKAALEKILAASPSDNLYEIVNRALNTTS